MRKDSPLAEKESITCEDLIGLPPICSRQSIQKIEGNTFVEWFSRKLIATFSLVYNAEFMVQQGMGCMITADHLANTSVNPDLCFRPLTPVLEAGLTIAWSKQRKSFSPCSIVSSRRVS